MTTIYKRYAVCSDTTWAALSTAEQAEYDSHYSSWTLWISETNKPDLAALQMGCAEVIIWDDFGTLDRYLLNNTTDMETDVNNFPIYRAHTSARPSGAVGGSIKMHGVHYSYMDYALFDGFEFDQSVYTDPTDGYFIYCNGNHVYFENCIFSNIDSLYGSLNLGYFKNCLFYQMRSYLRNGATDVLVVNCGFYSTQTYASGTFVNPGECYNCWTYAENRGTGAHFGSSCTGDNNYASDGSGPIAERTLASFGFTDAANGDFTLTTSSPLYDRGTTQGEELDTDMIGNPRIAGAELDLGPFELEVQTSITFSGVVVGSSISMIDLDNGGYIVSPFTATTTEESAEVTLASSVNVSVKIRNASSATKYLPWRSDFLLTSAGATLFVSQVEDTIA